jgi:hypothetical protein
MKRLFSLILSATVITMVIVSCEDDFSEQDFLKLQSELKLKQDSIQRLRDQAASDSSSKEVVESYIAAQNAAGELMAVTIVVREDNTPVQGATVTLSSGAPKADGGRTKAVLTGTTDALGVIVFESTVIANSSVTVSRPGFLTATALVDFGAPDAPIAVTVPNPVTGGTKTIFISPQKRFENIALPLFSESAAEGSTAVINGTFRIENDMTNDPLTPDAIPTGLTISANVAGALAGSGAINSSCGCVGDYRFAGAEGSLGVAPINADGTWSMRVPATANGIEIELIYPEISGTSRMAVRRLNGQDISPVFRDVPTLWQPGNFASVNAGTNAIPQIPGAMAVFNTGTPPPAPGRGFTISTAVVPRSLGEGVISNNGTSNVIDQITYNLVLRGRGYNASPAIAIGSTTGSGAEAVASLRGYIVSATITGGGTGYAADTPYDVQFTYVDVASNVTVINKVDVTSNSTGSLPALPLELPVGYGFPGGAMFTTGFEVAAFGVRVVENNTNTPAVPTTNATFTVVRETEIDEIAITDGGSGYASAPSFTFTGGGSPSAQAVLSVAAFRAQYAITLSTAPATTPYKLLPAQFVFTYPSNAIDGQMIEAPAQVDRLSSNLTAVQQNVSFISQVVTDGTNISALNPQHTFRTTTYWTNPPSLTVIDQTITRAAANVVISSTGGVTAIINPETDSPTLNDLFPTAASTSAGNGYDVLGVAIVPTITGAPGTGASFILDNSYNVATRETTWNGVAAAASVGSGYLQNLNRAASNIAYGVVTPVTVKTGQTYTITIHAGHGVRLETVTN